MQRLDVADLSVLEHASAILEQALAVEAAESGDGATACPGNADARAE